MSVILGAVMFVLMLVAGGRTIKLGIKTVNMIFDKIEDQMR